MEAKLNFEVETRMKEKYTVSIPATIDGPHSIPNEDDVLLNVARINTCTITPESETLKGPMSEKEFNANAFYDGALDALIDRVSRIDKGDTTYMEEECSELLKEICKRRRYKDLPEASIIEEAVDVITACVVFLRYKDISNSEIKARMTSKLNRTIILERN